jgi:hypothetical protein
MINLTNDFTVDFSIFLWIWMWNQIWFRRFSIRFKFMNATALIENTFSCVRIPYAALSFSKVLTKWDLRGRFQLRWGFLRSHNSSKLDNESHWTLRNRCSAAPLRCCGREKPWVISQWIRVLWRFDRRVELSPVWDRNRSHLRQLLVRDAENDAREYSVEFDAKN